MRRILATALATSLIAGSTSPARADEGSIRGRVIDEEGRPLAGMQVRTSCDGDERELRTGADGRYSRPAGSADRCTAEARDPAGNRIARDRRMGNQVPDPGSWGSLGDVNPRGSAIDIGDRQMFLPVEVAGRLVDSRTGAGIKDLYVSVQDGNGPVDGGLTRADGRFGPVRQWPGRYHLTVRAEQTDGSEADYGIYSAEPASHGHLLAPGARLDVGTVRIDRSGRSVGTFVVAGNTHWVTAVPHPRAIRRQTIRPAGGREGEDPGTYLLRYDNGIWFGGRSELSARPVKLAAGRTVTLPAPSPTIRHGVIATDATGKRASGVFVTAYLADDPVEVIGTAVTDHNGEARIEGLPASRKVVLTWTDLWGRYATRTRVPYASVRLGMSRNGLPADPHSSDPSTAGALVVPGENRDGKNAPTFGLQVYDADDPSRPVAVSGSTVETSLTVPPGRYKIRLIDPTGRFATTYLGGAARFADARVFSPWVEFSRGLQSARLRPALAPLVAPRITDTPKVGRTMKADRGLWNGSPRTYSYRWYRNGKVISKATKSSYRVTRTDVGRRLTVKVTAKTSGGQTRAASSRFVAPRR